MKRPLPRLRLDDAFTLIELLTVITIISILMAMLFPFILGAKDTANAKKAYTDCQTIVHAVEQYNVEYSQYPKISSAGGSATGTIPDDAAGDVAAGMGDRNSALFNTLRNIDRTPNSGHLQNPRQQVFLEGKAVSNTDKPRGGFLEVAGGSGSQGCWYDPWGIEYNVVIDTNSDGVITVDNYYEDFKTTSAPRVTCGAFSLGKDKLLGKKGNKKYRDGVDYSDDQVSWTSH